MPPLRLVSRPFRGFSLLMNLPTSFHLVPLLTLHGNFVFVLQNHCSHCFFGGEGARWWLLVFKVVESTAIVRHGM